MKVAEGVDIGGLSKVEISEYFDHIKKAKSKFVKDTSDEMFAKCNSMSKDAFVQAF